MQSYASARKEFDGSDAIFLDANENPFGIYNRYPDPFQIPLKQTLSELKNIPIEHIFLGNGSDEILDLIVRVFCEPHQDQIIQCPPTFGMYEVVAALNAVPLVNIPLTESFQLDVDRILANITEHSKMIFLCSPNNPSGNVLLDIPIILQKFKGIVIVDEAYIDFSAQPSLLSELKNYPNLIIVQTLSKAWGAAGLRLGMAFASPEIIALLNKVKYPYNISAANQKAALDILQNKVVFQNDVAVLLEQRDRVIEKLNQFPFIVKIYPTDANFVLVKVENATQLYQFLKDRNVIVRNRSKAVTNTLRITIGSEAENTALIESLEQYNLIKTTH